MNRRVRWVIRIIILLALVALGLTMVRMPGDREPVRNGPPTPISMGEETMTVDELARRLEGDVRVLADSIGERNVYRPEALEATVTFLEKELEDAGFRPVRQSFQVQGVECHNLEVEIQGTHRPEEIIVIGAHYDSVVGSPGANDNGTGVAAVLALARIFADAQPPRTLRFVFFVNEEPPFFTTPEMGSVVYARRSGERGEDIRGMLSLETIGYYDDTPGSQSYPVGMLGWAYPDRGDFIGFVSNLRSGSLLRTALGTFREHAAIPSEGAALPSFLPGVGWSDHWSFWQEGYSAIMLTDTAPFRDPGYHTPDDTPDRLDFHRVAQIVNGLVPVVETLTR